MTWAGPISGISDGVVRLGEIGIGYFGGLQFNGAIGLEWRHYDAGRQHGHCQCLRKGRGDE